MQRESKVHDIIIIYLITLLHPGPVISSRRALCTRVYMYMQRWMHLYLSTDLSVCDYATQSIAISPIYKLSDLVSSPGQIYQLYLPIYSFINMPLFQNMPWKIVD